LGHGTSDAASFVAPAAFKCRSTCAQYVHSKPSLP
jgi:hypothetical protein